MAHVVIDGVIDTRSLKAKLPDLYKRKSAEGSLMKSTDIADVYYSLHEQPRTAWSFEIDIRPTGENF